MVKLCLLAVIAAIFLIRAQVARAAFLHSHNDYEQDRPLLIALESRLDSVEADVWWVDGRILLSHFGLDFVGSLEKLYLKPLQERVNRLGSVYGDGKEFLLWIDIKDSSRMLRDALFEALSRYPMLSEFAGETVVRQGAVTAVLTGSNNSKVEFMREHPVRRACRDSLEFSRDDAPAGAEWRWYSLNWDNYFSWKGDGEMPLMERWKLHRLLRKAHVLGRKVRFFNTPESESFWKVVSAAGVDALSTDVPGRLRAFADQTTYRGPASTKPVNRDLLHLLNFTRKYFEIPFAASLLGAGPHIGADPIY